MRESLTPGQLMKNLADDDWMRAHGVDRANTEIHLMDIFHDDWCPCADGGAGLPRCTCSIVEIEVRRVG